MKQLDEIYTVGPITSFRLLPPPCSDHGQLLDRDQTGARVIGLFKFTCG